MDDSFFSSSPVREDRPRTPASRLPSAARTPPRTPGSPPRTPPTTTTPQHPLSGTNTPYDAEETREAVLQQELDGVRQINETLEGLLQTLERSRGDMKTVFQTVSNASALLNTWTRLLSQTEHNQRLILDPTWHGATQDIADAEAEALQRQQEEERRAAEAQRRRDEARRKAEDNERRRLAGPSSSSSSTRGARGSGLRSRGRVTYTVSGVVRRGSTTGTGRTTSTGTTSRYGRGGSSTTGTTRTAGTAGTASTASTASTTSASTSNYGYRGTSRGRVVRGSRPGGRGVR